VVYGGIPVFADIEPDLFCISAATIRRRLTPHTRAIIVVDLFGHPAEMDEIMTLAREHNLLVIEDAAQAPGARYKGRHAGTLADIGVFSLNYHKTIHCGEGGVCVTRDDQLAERLRLIRNHAEVVVGPKGERNLCNMVGFNYRMTEIEAAIAAEQLKKLERLLKPRVEAARQLTERLSGLPGITPPVVRPYALHGYYVYAIRYNAGMVGAPRQRFAEALAAEGVPVSEGYVQPIYWQPMYQQRMAIGSGGFPFSYPGYRGQVSYDRGTCPVAERMYEEVLLADVCHANISQADLDDFVRGFEKVVGNASEL
jgi:dTDP-4-amino-4,6-dideoxygalactose transaminase